MACSNQFLGHCVQRLPEFRFLSLGVKVEIRTAAVRPRTLNPRRRDAYGKRKLQALLPDPFGLQVAGVPGILEAEFRRRVILQHNAAVVLQNKFRALLSRWFRKQCLKLQRAATTLCRWYRGCVGRKVRPSIVP
jgi:hypothetical protein